MIPSATANHARRAATTGAAHAIPGQKNVASARGGLICTARPGRWPGCAAASAAFMLSWSRPKPPKSNAPPPWMASTRSAIQTTKNTTLPSPPRSPGRVSKSTASAATSAIAGRASRAKGARRAPSSSGASPANDCSATAAAASTATIVPSTAVFETSLASTYCTRLNAVVARISPTPVSRSRVTLPLTR